MGAYIVSETGVVTEIRRANYISWTRMGDCYAALYEGDPDIGGRFICRVPKGHLVSFDRPGVVQQAADAKDVSLSNSLEIVTACIRNIRLDWKNAKRLKALKAALNDFDARAKRWK